jgi:hypothetical protein
MKKVDMIKNLLDEGFDTPDLKWKELQLYYKEKMEEVESRNSLIIEKPTEKSIEERVEIKIELQPDLRTPLEKKREELYPLIVELMIKMKGKTRASQDELNEMFSLYNQFYLRHDQPNCGSCVSRVWSTFKKICKGRM